MRLIRETNYDFMSKRRWTFLFSLAIIGPGLVSMAVRGGLRLGGDFTGGTQIEVRLSEKSGGARGEGPIAWDLGANTGKFSRIASKMNVPTIAFDIDPAAVELNYRQCVSDHEVNLLPLIADLTNPSPGIGWQNHERMSLLERGPVDAVLALALIHHLAISNNVPLGRIAEFFHQAGQWLVIEFVPKTDSQVQRLLATRKDIFTSYNPQGFEVAFTDYFVIRDVQKIPESERCLYLMERK